MTDSVVRRSADGWIRIRPRLAQLERVSTLVQALVAHGEAVERDPIQDLVTGEGELAVLAGARFVEAGVTCEATVIVIGDCPALLIEAVGTPGVVRTRAVALMRELGLGLGEMRRRWYRYDPPTGWLGARRHGVTAWLHPDHPRVHAIAHVFDARPFLRGDTEQLELFVRNKMPGGFAPVGESIVGDLPSRYGLDGKTRFVIGTDHRGQELARLAVAFTDDRFTYLAHFEGVNQPTILDTVRTLFESFRPLPIRPNQDAYAMYDS